MLARRAMLEQANADLKRYSALTPGVVVSTQKMDQVIATQGSAKAAYDQAVADLALAKLNLERSEVRASVNGVVTNMELRPGTYLTPGKGVMALLDSDTLHVQGYFEETKLPRIHLGDPVNVRLMGSDHALRGRVESVAAGIEDRDRSAGATLLANVNPTFNWVRLAQRVPVRIALDRAERNELVAGATATVEVLGSAPRSDTTEGSGIDHPSALVSRARTVSDLRTSELLGSDQLWFRKMLVVLLVLVSAGSFAAHILDAFRAGPHAVDFRPSHSASDRTPAWPALKI